MKSKWVYPILIGLIIVMVVVLSQKNYALRENDREQYVVEITRTYMMSEEPNDTISKSVAPGEPGTLIKDVTVKRTGSIKGGHANAEKQIKERVTINPDAVIKFTSPKGTVMVNPQTIGGEYGAGFVASLGFYTRYIVQEGYTCVVNPDGTYGEKISFIAKEPQGVWLGWKTVKAYDPDKELD